MPKSYLTPDPDFKSFPQHTALGQRYRGALDDLSSLKRQLAIAPLPELRSMYIRASNACAKLQAELEKRHHWPPDAAA